MAAQLVCTEGEGEAHWHSGRGTRFLCAASLQWPHPAFQKEVRASPWEEAAQESATGRRGLAVSPCCTWPPRKGLPGCSNHPALFSDVRSVRALQGLGCSWKMQAQGPETYYVRFSGLGTGSPNFPNRLWDSSRHHASASRAKPVPQFPLSEPR